MSAIQGESTPLTAQTLSGFLDQLASDAPTPGGGSVAALVGALAAALGRMAGQFTLGREKFANVQAQVQELDARLHHAATALAASIDEDARAYAQLSAAFKLPRDDANRQTEIARAALVAASVPLQTAVLARRAEADLTVLRDICNPNLTSDVEVGLHLTRAAIHSAAINVRVNLSLLPTADRARIESELNHVVEAPAANR